MSVMRAKMVLDSVESAYEGSEQLVFRAVSVDGSYPEDGSDENNTYAKFTPSAEMKIDIRNPDLLDKFKTGQTFYVDFTEVEG